MNSRQKKREKIKYLSGEKRGENRKSAEKREEVSAIGRLTREMMSDVMETALKKPIQTGEFRKRPVEPAWRCPAGYVYRLVELDACTVEYLTPEDAVTGRVILQLHGGGYIGPMKNIYRRFAVRYSKISYGADVLSVDYRVAPEHPFPAALEDAAAGYRWLLEEKGYEPEKIVIAGDSAGGGLALSLVLYLKDKGLPLPGGIITMSPWADVTLSGESYESKYEIDPLFGNSRENMLYQCSYIGDADPKNPYLSPLFGDFSGFPPILMQVGEYEVLLSDTIRVSDKAKKAGVKVRTSVYAGMFHVFQMGLDLIPESREAWEEIGEFLRIIYGIQRKDDGKLVKKVKNRKPETEARARELLKAMIRGELSGSRKDQGGEEQ
ncbi:MAG: alpha/beta hydrolase [Clostridium sp.]|nr:alpha/beta hydrolase [Clostridium sp.]